jgi:amidohydrolase
MSMRHCATAIQDELTRLRRALHREPELGLSLPRTQEKVLAALDGMPLTINTGQHLTSVTAVLHGARPGPTILLRGDMDALPLAERADSAYASRFPGRMHACGHDLHTAMLVGAAWLLAERRDRLAGDVVFMFQPGEEGHAGARLMIEEGVLEASGKRPLAAYALHVFASLLPRGTFVTRPGPIMAAADALTVTVHGQGGHSASPHRAKDPVPVACEMVTALQAMVTRGFDIFDPVVVTVGSFHAGTADNIIPATARFEATLRSFSPVARARMRDRSQRLMRGIAEAHGVRVEADYRFNYPVTVNDGDETAFAADTVREVYGEERFASLPQPFAGAEDFAFVSGQIPSAYMILGACPPDRDPALAPGNHAPEAAFDDAVLAEGAALYAELALRRSAAETNAASQS